MQDVPMWWPTNKPNVVFLDTSISTFPDGQVEVEVYRKTTHTDKYLSFNSHHPMQHKRSVVSTLMRRANAVPSNQSLKTQEQKLMHIQESLQTNGYSTPCPKVNQKENQVPKPTGVTVIPYVCTCKGS